MAEYHVAAGMAAIYAGTVNKGLWRSRSVVTDEATAAVAQYLLDTKQVMRFEYLGKKYKLCVMEVCDNG